MSAQIDRVAEQIKTYVEEWPESPVMLVFDREVRRLYFTILRTNEVEKRLAEGEGE